VKRPAPLFALLVVAAPGPLAAQAGEELLRLRERAQRYLESGQVDRALAAVERARRLPEAGGDGALEVLAARIHLESGDLERAAAALEVAAGAEDPGVVAAAWELKRRIASDHGPVTVSPLDGKPVRARLWLHAETSPSGLSRQRALTRARLAVGEIVRAWPSTFLLPWGTYRANGVRFDHAPSEAGTRLSVPFPRVAVLRPSADAVAGDAVRALLGDLGGQVELYDDAGPGLGALLPDLRRHPPALVMGVGQAGAEAGRRGLPAVPLVYLRVPDHAALRDLGGTAPMTGMLARPPPRAVLERLRRLAPGVRSVGVLHDPRLSKADADEAEKAGRAVGLKVTTAAVTRHEDVGAALATPGDAVDAWWLFADPAAATDANLTVLVRHGLARRRPVVVPDAHGLREGGLMAVVPDPAAEGRDAAMIAREALYGSGLPARGAFRVREVRWIVQRDVARRLGISIPAAVLRDASEVIDLAPPPEVLP